MQLSTYIDVTKLPRRFALHNVAMNEKEEIT